MKVMTIMGTRPEMIKMWSVLRKLDELIKREIKISVKIPEDPMTAVVRGCGVILENLPKLRDILISTEELEPPK